MPSLPDIIVISSWFVFSPVIVQQALILSMKYFHAYRFCPLDFQQVPEIMALTTVLIVAVCFSPDEIAHAGISY